MDKSGRGWFWHLAIHPYHPCQPWMLKIIFVQVLATVMSSVIKPINSSISLRKYLKNKLKIYIKKIFKITFASHIAFSSDISRSAPITIVNLEKSPIVRSISVGSSYDCSVPRTFRFDKAYPLKYIYVYYNRIWLGKLWDLQFGRSANPCLLSSWANSHLVRILAVTPWAATRKRKRYVYEYILVSLSICI